MSSEYGFTASTSRRGNCWDKACSETLFGSLKVERLHGKERRYRLAALVQPDPIALDAGLRQPDTVRAQMACGSSQAINL